MYYRRALRQHEHHYQYGLLRRLGGKRLLTVPAMPTKPSVQQQSGPLR
jgi:hypothetical protein